MPKPAELDPAVLEYIAEGKEIIERVSKALGVIETGSHDKETLSSLYRDVHTLKGTSQLFGYKLTAQVSHALESCLDPVRKGKAQPNPALIRACAMNMDLIDRLLQSIESNGREFQDDKEVVRMISLLVEAATELQGWGTVSKDTLHLEENLKNDEFSKNLKGSEEKLKTEELPKNVINAAPAFVSESSTQEASKGSPAAGSSQGDATIRVQVNLLDRILNLVGELVLVRNQLLQFRSQIDNSDFLASSKSLDVVTSDLQGEIMKTRMQPIETVVGKFQRLVRDISRDLGKRIDLTLEGSDTELDKSLLEAIRDPLTHIVRNSCDHGIEFPEDRKKFNKPETGHLLIRSYHEGGQVVIEVSDDGRGIHRNNVLRKAIEKNLLTQEKADKLSDREICELIFLPGFSTASEVTSVSGRGVGMDVVKTNIEKIGGSVEIKSLEGKGTTLQLRIPLTLAIVPALIVKSGKAKFAIPQVKLVELVRVDSRNFNSTQIEKLQDRPMFRLRGHLLPLYDLRDITAEKYDLNYPEGVYIVVLNFEGENFGLLVPEILDTADIVVKPMGSVLNSIPSFSGATILGDGSIALILDVGGLAEHAHVLNKRIQKEEKENFSKNEKAQINTDIQEFLLFSLGDGTVHSLPLCLVNRLEEFSVADIEKTGNQRIVRYRDSLLPLLSLKQMLKYDSKESHEKGFEQKERVSVIVVNRSGRSFGFVVDEILDVATIQGNIDDGICDRDGILGNLVFNDEVVVVIDALGLIEEFNETISGKGNVSKRDKRDSMGELRDLNKEMKFKSIRVLYAEDVAFFRKHVSKVLAAAGIDVTTVEDGAKALQELDASEADRYNLILSDIEMPHLDGLEFARELRKRERFKKTPLIALTTRFNTSDIEEGRLAGFSSYLEKLNPEKLLEEISSLMGQDLKILEKVL